MSFVVAEEELNPKTLVGAIEYAAKMASMDFALRATQTNITSEFLKKFGI
jgi:hypothetical protein